MTNEPTQDAGHEGQAWNPPLRYEWGEYGELKILRGDDLLSVYHEMDNASRIVRALEAENAALREERGALIHEGNQRARETREERSRLLIERDNLRGRAEAAEAENAALTRERDRATAMAELIAGSGGAATERKGYEQARKAAEDYLAGREPSLYAEMLRETAHHYEAENAALRLETLRAKAAYAQHLESCDLRAYYEAENAALRRERNDYRKRKDAAYEERNRVVAALARLFPSGIARTAIEGWDEEWHGCVYIDSPVGQLSWHFHDSQAHFFEGLPAYEGTWDGHSTEDKYARLATIKAEAELETLRMFVNEARDWFGPNKHGFEWAARYDAYLAATAAEPAEVKDES